MTLNSGLAPNVVKTALDKVFRQEFDYPSGPGIATARDEMVFKQDSASNAAVITEEQMGSGYFGSRSETQDVPQATVRVGNQKTSSVVNYSQSIDISKNLFDDDQHTVVGNTISTMGYNAKKTQDKNAFAVYNNSFTTQTTNDAVAVFSNSHVRLDGGAVDNLETGVLTVSNFETAIVSLAHQLTQDGTLGGYEPYCLLVPNDLWKEAVEITASELLPNTANNATNWVSQTWPTLSVKRSPFLAASQGGSATAWFLLSRFHSFTRFVRQDLQTSMVDWQYSRNNAYVYKAEYREVVDVISFGGAVGSNGTV